MRWGRAREGSVRSPATERSAPRLLQWAASLSPEPGPYLESSGGLVVGSGSVETRCLPPSHTHTHTPPLCGYECDTP